ncbi:MAG: adenylate kinase [Caldiserica bacterium]|nr:MAG: adenylate kinase [Caldisericota bacterium]
MKIVMLGNIGVGKGTQGRKLSEKFNIPYIATGDIFRENIRNETPLGKKVKDILKEGKLVPDEVVNEIVFDKINNLEGFVLDGFPRTLFQAEQLEKFLKLNNNPLNFVLYLTLSEDTIVKRITGRRVCPKCGRIYNIYFNPPKNDEICDFDGEKLIQREDDNLEVVKKRIEEFKKNTFPLIDFYRERKILFEIDGEGTPDEVFNRIVKTIDDNTKE